MRDDMFFGTSILHWFWRGLGRGLGPPNRCFSYIFRWFFDVKIEVRFETRKNRFKNRKKQTFPLFGAGFAVPGGPWGERKRERGTNFGRRISKKNFEIIPTMPSQSPARRCPPRWGGGLKPPRGGVHRRPPTLGASVIEFFVLAGFWPLWRIWLSWHYWHCVWERPCRRNEANNGPNDRKIVPRPLQNRGRGPPKSSLEPSKT